MTCLIDLLNEEKNAVCDIEKWSDLIAVVRGRRSLTGRSVNSDYAKEHAMEMDRLARGYFDEKKAAEERLKECRKNIAQYLQNIMNSKEEDLCHF